MRQWQKPNRARPRGVQPSGKSLLDSLGLLCYNVEEFKYVLTYPYPARKPFRLFTHFFSGKAAYLSN
ncbi:MAG TPA: hypothetical protein DIV41_04230 [Ruminococcaceae bacterium]|nr:hypothetical protein [Oscillospiraceae bacterium]